MPVRLLVVGASGRTGRLLVAAALGHCHEVTALVRDPARAEFAPGVSVVTGDVLQRDSLAPALKHQEVVVSLLAPRPRLNGRVYLEGTRNLTDAAVAASVKRLVVVSAEGAGVEPDELPLAYRIVMRIPVVAKLYPDIAEMDRELAARTDIDWTIVRPAVRTNGPATGCYRIATGNVVPHGLRISRADLADLLLRIAEDRSHVRERVAIAD